MTDAQTRARSGALMAVASMMCVQLGVAVSVSLIDDVGPEGAAWVRTTWAGLIFLALGRPWRLRVSRSGLLAAIGLGTAIGAITLLFMAAVARLPLGTASALEFLGPLGVAVARGHGPARQRLLWPGLAAVGVLLLTQPWSGHVDPVGVGLALAAAVCWAAYILLTQRVGDELAGIRGLAISMPVAGLVATLAVGPVVVPRMTPEVLLAGLGIALLMPTVPFALEMLALQRLTTAAFGTLMCLEPAFALVIGLIVLSQVPGWLAVVGVGFVVAAGVGAERTGARPPALADPVPVT